MFDIHLVQGDNDDDDHHDDHIGENDPDNVWIYSPCSVWQWQSS